MGKFIIVDTWNGEGYSDSKAEIKEFKSGWEANQYVKKLALETVSAHHECIELKVDTVGATYTYYYGDQEEDGTFEDEDNGSYQFERFTGQYAVVINPMVNEYRTIDTKEEFENQLEEWINNAQDEEQKQDLKNRDFSGCFDSLEEGDVIIDILPIQLNLDNLEHQEGGDGVTHEYWKDKETGIVYEIPMQIERDWDNAEERKSFK